MRQLFEKLFGSKSELATAPGKLWRAGYLTLRLPEEYLLTRNTCVLIQGAEPPMQFGRVLEKLPPGRPMPRAPIAPKAPEKPAVKPASPAPATKLDLSIDDIFDPKTPLQVSDLAPRPPAYDPSIPPSFSYPIAEEGRWTWELPGASDAKQGKAQPSRELDLVIWHPEAPYPGGPMSVASRHPAELAGIQVEIAETTTFQGRMQRVLLVNLSLKSPAAHLQFYGSGFDTAEFAAILKMIQIEGNEIVSPRR